MIPSTIVLKLSSVSIISAAFLDTSVPEIPIAIPTSALFSAGASFIPSPVTATTSPLSCSAFTILILVSGLLLATIEILFISFFKSSSSNVSIYEASTAILPLSSKPNSSPIDFAVFILSPVSILTSTPALLAISIDSFTPSLNGSTIPTNPLNINLESFS